MSSSNLPLTNLQQGIEDIGKFTPKVLDTIEVSGRITFVSYKSNCWTVRTSTGDKCHLTYDGKYPVRVGDSICAICVPTEGGSIPTFKIMRSPSIVIPSDPDSVTETFIRLFKKDGLTYGTCRKLYRILDQQLPLEGHPDVIYVSQYITYISNDWKKTNNPDYLYPINKVLNNQQAIKLVNWWTRSVDRRKLYLLGLSEQDIRACERPLSVLYQQLLDNPFTVAPISIETCREIDTRTCRQEKPTDLYCGTIIRAIYKNMTSKGWSCTSYIWLDKRFENFPDYQGILTEEFDLVFDQVTLYKDDGKDRKNYRVVYLKTAYEAEMMVSTFLVQRSTRIQGQKVMDIEPGPIINIHDRLTHDKQLDQDQLTAVSEALRGGISIITGEPGTGKTTTIKEIVRVLKVYDIPYMMCSFTGQAVSRIKKVVSSYREPATMHRMIYSPNQFSGFKVLIVDEASMITTNLFYQLLVTYGTEFSVIFVGDAQQLPPISWGSLFHQMLKSRSITKTVLTNNYRVILGDGQHNAILSNLKRIIAWPDDTPYIFQPGSNFHLLEGNENNIMDFIKLFVKQGIKHDQFKIVCPYNRYLDQINRLAQLAYHGKNRELTLPDGRIIHQGDLVMCLVNDYDFNVMNGEEGVVTELGTSWLFVDFGDKRLIKVPFPKEKKNKIFYEDQGDETGLTTKHLTLSYAVTVHKVQGSEYPFVIFLMPSFADSTHSGFLNRNLIYTAISRARVQLYHVGDIMTTSRSIGNTLPYRCEFLHSRLRDQLPLLYDKEVKIELTSYHPANDEDLPPDDFWDDI